MLLCCSAWRRLAFGETVLRCTLSQTDRLKCCPHSWLPVSFDSLHHLPSPATSVGKVAEYSLIVLTHKMINVLALPNTGITFGTDVHGYDTRCKEYLRTVKPNSTALGCNNLYNIAAKLYNKFPKDIKNLSILKFKKQLKNDSCWKMWISLFFLWFENYFLYGPYDFFFM